MNGRWRQPDLADELAALIAAGVKTVTIPGLSQRLGQFFSFGGDAV